MKLSIRKQHGRRRVQKFTARLPSALCFLILSLCLIPPTAVCESGSAELSGESIFGEGYEIDKRIDEMLSKLDDELGLLGNLSKSVDLYIKALDEKATEARALSKHAAELWGGYQKDTREQKLIQVRQVCFGIAQHLAYLQQLDAQIDTYARQIADLIDNAGDAPESFKALDQAFEGIKWIAANLVQAQETKERLGTSLVTWVYYNRPPVASLRRAAQDTRDQIYSLRVELEGLRSSVDSWVSDIRKDTAEFEQLTQSTKMGIKRLQDALPESHQHRRAEFELRENIRAGIVMNPQASDVSRIVQRIDGDLADVTETAHGLETGEATVDRAIGEVELACGKQLSSREVVQQANDSIENIKASLSAITFVYASRESKINSTVDDELRLIHEHEENLRVANGKLKYIEPLIAERRGKSDAVSREQLTKLLNEQAELEQIKAEAESALEQVRKWYEQDNEEQRLLNSAGKAVVADAEQKSATLTTLSLADVEASAPESE